MAEKKLYEVIVKRMPKETLSNLLKLAEQRTGETFDAEDITMDLVYNLAEELGVTGTLIITGVRLVNAYTAAGAERFVWYQQSKDDFSVTFSIEASEAVIYDEDELEH